MCCQINPEILENEHFSKPIQVDGAHRSLQPVIEGKAQSIIAQLHHYQVKELVLRLAKKQKKQNHFRNQLSQRLGDQMLQI